MFLTIVRQRNGVELTLWTGEERVQAKLFSGNGFLPGGQAKKLNALEPAANWLDGLGVEALQAVLWEGPDSCGREREVQVSEGDSGSGSLGQGSGLENTGERLVPKNSGVDLHAETFIPTSDFRSLTSILFWARALVRTYGGSLYEIPAWWEEELPELARVSGFPGIERRGVYDRIAHAAALYQAEQELGLPRSGRIIVGSLGGGVSVAAYAAGRLLDVNNARDGEGPMGEKCAGTLPTEPLIHWVFTSGKTRTELEKGLVEGGGWAAYAGKMPKEEWEGILAYQVLKEIGAMRAVLRQEADLVVLTGEMASHQSVMARIKDSLPSSLPVLVIPGVDRSLGLARIWLTDICAERERGGELDSLRFLRGTLAAARRKLCSTEP